MANSTPASPSFAAPTAAYIHIPFCRRRCFYCDFPITVVGDRPQGQAQQQPGTIARYLQVLAQEIQQQVSFGVPLHTLFFGGGTPSLLTVAQLSNLIQLMQRQFGLDPGAEISMEIDPGTFDLEQLQGFQAAGVTRFSLGVQAFQPHLLRACGRSHGVEEIHQAIQTLQTAGITHYSLDLISGLPHQTLEDWADSLARAIAHKPAHISCYDLIVEPQTPFAKQYQPGLNPLPNDDNTAAMYRLAHEYLSTAGYEHYEISNYAQPGCQCRHNRVYWEYRSFYGFGLGATSYLAGQRRARPRKTQAYIDWVNAGGCLNAGEPLLDQPGSEGLVDAERFSTVQTIDRLLERLMLGLRLAEGVELHPLITEFGPGAIARVQQGLARYIAPGWVEITPSHIRLTQPEGFLFSNQVLAKLFELFEQ